MSRASGGREGAVSGVGHACAVPGAARFAELGAVRGAGRSSRCLGSDPSRRVLIEVLPIRPVRRVWLPPRRVSSR